MSALLVMLLSLLGAEAQIDAPATAKVGEFVLIDSAGSVGQVTWAVPDQQVSHFISGDRKQLVLHCPSPRFVKVRLTATDATGTSSDVVVIEFTGNGKPQPAPAPLPDVKPVVPEPDKKLPAGRFAIAQPAHDKAAEVKVATGDQRKTEALLLAAKLAIVRDRIQSGAIKGDDPGIVMHAIRAANAELPKDVQARWHGWGVWWGQTLFAHWKAGKLNAANDWSDVLDETILGLKAVK